MAARRKAARPFFYFFAVVIPTLAARFAFSALRKSNEQGSGCNDESAQPSARPHWFLKRKPRQEHSEHDARLAQRCHLRDRSDRLRPKYNSIARRGDCSGRQSTPGI